MKITAYSRSVPKNGAGTGNWTAPRAVTFIFFAAAIIFLSGLSRAHAAPPEGVSESGSTRGFEAKFMDVAGVRTRYYDEGSGEPLVLIHGGGAPLLGMASANTWIPVLGHIAKRFHVYAPDKLGSGMTDNPADPDDLNIAGEVQHIYEFVKALGLKKIHLVGQSRGGGLVFLFAVQHPELLHTLVIVDSSTAAPTAGDDRRRRWQTIFRHCPATPPTARWVCQYKALSYDPDTVDDVFIAASVYMMSQPRRQETQAMMTPERRKRNNALTNKMNHEAYGRMAEASIPSPQGGETSGNIMQMPVLIYWAKNDPSVLPIQGYSLFNIIAENNPKARMLFTNKAGHFHYREQPEEFSHSVISFIDYWMGRTSMKAALSTP